MSYRNRITIYLATLLLAALSCNGQAATVSYMLDQSKVLPDNIHYLTVTVSDDMEGQLDFWVNTESALSGLATSNFGIQSFALNLVGDLLKPGRYNGRHHGRDGYDDPGNEKSGKRHGFGDSERHHGRDGREHGEGRRCALDSLLTAESFILPEGWEVLFNKGKKEKFDVLLLGDAGSRQDPLHFSILGLGLEDILGEFGAKVAGFEFVVDECGKGHGQHLHECKPVTRAGFYGDTLIEGPVVPLPAALWLFGSGLLGLAGIARRRRCEA